MSKHWNPRVFDGGRPPRRPRGWPSEWDRHRPRRRAPVTWSELRLAILAGLALGLGYMWVQTDGVSPGGGDTVPKGAAIQVIDGDTFRYRGEKIRIADIDTPETHPPRCAYEAELGARATARLRELLAAGPFVMGRIDRDEDVYGRKLRIVMRDGKSIGDALVSEGLARPYGNGRRPWCG